MTQQQRLDFLLAALLRERGENGAIAVPTEPEEKKKLLRALMNVRMPDPISPDILRVQDEYLSAERDARGIVDGDRLPSVPSDSRIALWQGDITTLKADAIVNAANSALLGCFCPLHSCIDNIVNTRSGIQLRLFCHDIMSRQGHAEPTGQAKITPAFNLPSKYILHTVGAHHQRRCPEAGLRSPGLLLSLLFGAGGGELLPEHCLLLYFHRRISLSQ